MRIPHCLDYNHIYAKIIFLTLATKTLFYGGNDPQVRYNQDMTETFRVTSWNNWDQLTSGIKTPLLISVSFTGVLSIAATLYYFFAPQVIPLFYSLPRGEQSLTTKEWLFLFPIFSVVITILHSILISIFNDLDILILRLFAWTTIVMQFFVLITFVRIVVITF